MRKIICLLLVVVMVTGIIVSRRAAVAPADTGTKTGVPARQKSKAFQYMDAARRGPGKHTHAGGGRDGSHAEQETIDRLYGTGLKFLEGQDNYFQSLEDVNALNRASKLLTLGNRLMSAAVLTEMSRSADYSAQLVNMLQEESFRWYVTHVLSEYFPLLSTHIERGEEIDAGNLAILFPGDRDFLSEFDSDVAVNVSAEYAAEFETGIASYIAAEVLAWQAVRTGRRDRLQTDQFFWETLHRENNRLQPDSAGETINPPR